MVERIRTEGNSLDASDHCNVCGADFIPGQKRVETEEGVYCPRCWRKFSGMAPLGTGATVSMGADHPAV